MALIGIALASMGAALGGRVRSDAGVGPGPGPGSAAHEAPFDGTEEAGLASCPRIADEDGDGAGAGVLRRAHAITDTPVRIASIRTELTGRDYTRGRDACGVDRDGADHLAPRAIGRGARPELRGIDGVRSDGWHAPRAR